MRCNDSRLKVLLCDDEDSAEFRSASNHVESCPRCQQRLLAMSGDQSLLQEVRTTLQANIISLRLQTLVNEANGLGFPDEDFRTSYPVLLQLPISSPAERFELDPDSDVRNR